MVNTKVNKVKSCTGCLYYSSRFKIKSPVCIGFTASLPDGIPKSLHPNVTQFGVKKARIEELKKNRNLSDFRYTSFGYSLYFDRNGDDSKGQESQTELPAYVFGVFMTRVRKKQDDTALPQHQSPRPTNSKGDEFLSRFIRNANLVTNGVAKNIRRVGKQIKQGLDDALEPYRKRPK